MVIPVYLSAHRRRHRKPVIQIHGAVMEHLVPVPLLLGVALSQAGIQGHPAQKGPQGRIIILLKDVTECRVFGRSASLFHLFHEAVVPFIFPRIVGVGELEGAAVVGVGQPGFLYVLKNEED